MDGVVSAVAQDAQGYIWAGGATGVARYDGYHFVRFPLKAHAGDAEVISSVTTIAAGRDGRLWLGLVSVGLVALDPRTGRSVFYRHDPKNPHSLADGSVRAIVSDGADGFWIGTQGAGLDHFDPATGRFAHFRAAHDGLPDDDIAALLLDSRGDLWVGGANGLVRKPRAADRYAPVLSDPRDAARLARQGVSRLREDRRGRLWVGTQSGGLLIVDPASGQATWLVDGEAVSSGPVSAIEEADGNQMWIGRSNGIEIRAADSGAARQWIRHVAGRTGSLASPDVQGIVRDRSGVLFVGMYGGGVQRYVPPLPGIFVHRPALDDPWDGIGIRSILEMRNGEIWLGRALRGISVLDQGLRRAGDIALPGQSGGGGAPAGMVAAMAQGPDGHAWIGADNGLYEFDEGRRFVRRYDVGGKIRRMLADRDGVVWIGTGNGLLRRDPGAATLAPVMLARGGPMRGNVDALAQDPAGRVWAGNVAGIFRIDTATGTAHKLEAAPTPADGHHAVKGMLADAAGLWIDSDGGRYRIDRIDGDQARYTLAFGRTGPGGHAIGANLLRDQAGRIWTHRGVHDPAARRYDELSVADGVDIGTGWFRSYTQLRDGRMLFGGTAGLLQVEPDKYAAWLYRPPVVLTALSVGARPVDLPAAGKITIAPPRRSFRAEFSALDYSFPERNRYRYRLQGYDSGWRETGANLRVASYDNLPPGEYVLQVQGSNRDGAWSDAVASLAVTSLPAWWETWWARLGMLALAGTAVMGVVQWRTLRLRRRKEELELRVAERTAELQEVSAALAVKSQALELASLTDPLTGLHNRRFLSEHIDADVALCVRRHEDRLRRAGAPADDADLIFFLIDIDHFKHVNDQHGHAAGDAVLCQMRYRLQAIFRESDYVIRWGGEEFLVVARGTRRERAAELAERTRAAIADEPFTLPDGGALPKTCSIGYACFPLACKFPRLLDWQAVGELADAALYLVKNSGRNGWYGVTAVETQDVEGLRHLMRQPLAEWEGNGGTIIQRS
ncbi:diguanylate cyclase (GGDEF) domain-containing protein [Pseudoduganella namucuonensis]|uniref:diguanylate cyclase n=2 Tax=Pseudoduganella namucuonensis TaxID=1035707 RepID=A0A1I7KWB2_9BURK|nr:diguanylate cyclase (GGDEF) domain-containing protein [Pseudoduganella namucuonensis]